MMNMRQGVALVASAGLGRRVGGGGGRARSRGPEGVLVRRSKRDERHQNERATFQPPLHHIDVSSIIM